ncbi:MAG: Fe-S cluster assembly protein SufD [Proteobacteria bacterium]|nr:MAG: Fe-S cluster assembly protein SufD [Pseudomonadota bacterium]
MTAQFHTAFQDFVADAQWTPAWLKGLRQRSYDRFVEQGLPTRQDENWKYTSTRSLSEASFGLSRKTEISNIVVDRLSVKDSSRIVFVNGAYKSELSILPDDIEVSALNDVLDDDQDLIQPLFDEEGDSFTALNQAFFSTGVMVRVKKNSIVKKPLQLLFVQSVEDAPSMVSPRNIVFVEGGAQVKIIESHFGQTKNFTNAVTDVFVKDAAHCQYILERSIGNETRYVSKHCFHIGRDAQVETFNLALGGRLNRSHLEFRLNAPGAYAKLDGLYIARDDNHIDNVTEVMHLSHHTNSAQLYKGVLEGKSRAVFNGRITIVKDAQQVDAQQLNKNLLMSPDAEVDSRPQLAIDANDVKCSHGATIGQIDAQELFYLQSRCISREDAKRMLATAFIGDVVGRISGTHFTKHVQDVLQSFGGARN